MRLFGGPSLRQEYAAEIKEIEFGKKRTPNHQKPDDLVDGFFVDKNTRYVFDQFRDFAEVINQSLVWGAWSFEETANTDIGDMSGPWFGRSYLIFLNHLVVGKARLGASLSSFREEPIDAKADLFLSIRYAQFIDFSTLSTFLKDAFYLISDDDDSLSARADKYVEVTMLRHLWDAVAVPDVAQELTFRVEGSYGYFRQLQSIRAAEQPA